MDCVYIQRTRYPSDKDAQAYVNHRDEHEAEHPWLQHVFRRTQVGSYVYEYFWSELPDGETMDRLFNAQVQAKDRMLMMPGSFTRKTSVNGYDAALTDYDDED